MSATTAGTSSGAEAAEVDAMLAAADAESGVSAGDSFAGIDDLIASAEAAATTDQPETSARDPEQGEAGDVAVDAALDDALEEALDEAELASGVEPTPPPENHHAADATFLDMAALLNEADDASSSEDPGMFAPIEPPAELAPEAAIETEPESEKSAPAEVVVDVPGGAAPEDVRVPDAAETAPEPEPPAPVAVAPVAAPSVTERSAAAPPAGAKTPAESPPPAASKPLALLNAAALAALAPLSKLSPQVSQTLGWVAAVTLFQAVCVWTYGLFLAGPSKAVAAATVAHDDGQGSKGGHDAKKSDSHGKKDAHGKTDDGHGKSGKSEKKAGDKKAGDKKSADKKSSGKDKAKKSTGQH